MDFKQRRAMSPLLATVILIAFAVAIGALIMNWTTNINIASCIDAEIEFMKIGEKPTICYNNGKINLVVLVKGNTNIEGLLVRITDEDLNVVDKIIEQKAAKGDTIRANIEYVKNKSVRVDVYPIIDRLDKEEICTDRGIYVDPLGDC